MLSSNKTEGVFDHQNKWKESMSYIFCIEIVTKGRFHEILLEVVWCGQARPVRLWTCLDLTGVNLIGQGRWNKKYIKYIGYIKNNSNWNIGSALRKQKCLFVMHYYVNFQIIE